MGENSFQKIYFDAIATPKDAVSENESILDFLEEDIFENEEMPELEKIVHPANCSLEEEPPKPKKREISVSEAKPSEVEPVKVKRKVKKPTLDTEVEKIFNAYEKHFFEDASKWLTFGVVKAIERGSVNLPTSGLISRGFYFCEQEKIHEKLDPDDAMSEESNAAEFNLRSRVSRDMIGYKSEELPKQDIKRAKLKGCLYSIYSGAYIDDRKKVTYFISSEKGSEVRDFMENSGVNFKQFGENAHARTLSYQGFVNVIEAIKYNNKETEHGFKVLDWYFDSFGYGKKENIKATLGNLESYSEEADDAWRVKYEDYLKTRQEVSKFYQEQEKNGKKPVFERENIKEISVEDLIAKISLVKESRGNYGAPKEINPSKGVSIEVILDDIEAGQYSYVDCKKLNMIIAKFAEYKAFVDPNIKLYEAFQVNNNTGKETHYCIFDYLKQDKKISITVPYESKSCDSAFVVVGSGDIKSFSYHADIKNGRDSIQNLWFNLEKYTKTRN